MLNISLVIYADMYQSNITIFKMNNYKGVTYMKLFNHKESVCIAYCTSYM